MTRRKGLLAPQNTFLDTISTRFNGTHSNFLLGSAQVPGTFPIVYCSDGFCDLTGFPRSQVMQRCCSCEFLYGESTSYDDTRSIKEALNDKEEFETEICLYRKDGSPFLCLLDIVPIKDGSNNVVMFLASLKKVHNASGETTPNEFVADEYPALQSNNVSAAHYRSMFKGKEALSVDYLRPGHIFFNEIPVSPDVISQQPSFDKLNDRRRSRAVLYNLSENLEKKKRKGFFRTFADRLLGRRKSTVPEYKVAAALKSPLTILHFATAKTIWDWFVVLVTIYVTAVVPYYAAIQSVPVGGNATARSVFFVNHHSHPENNPAGLAMDVLVEIVFIVDIVFTFRTTYVNKSGWVVSDPRSIALNYLRTWFFFDLIAALPVDTIAHISDINFAAQPVPLLKTVRLLRLFRLLHKIDRWSQYSSIVLGMLMIMFALVAHWLACIWLTIGWNEFEQQATGTSDGVGWLYELSETLHRPFYANGTGGPDVTTSYITSLYFTLSSLTSVGFGNVSANTNSEKIFSICVMMIGALMHAVVFGNVTAIIQRMYARRQQYDIKMGDLKDFIKVHSLSKPVKRRMIDFFQQTWEESGGVNPHEILKDFPREIRADVAMHLHKELLNMPLFQIGNQGFRRYLALHARRCKVAPGEHVIYEGDPLETVNVVCNGSLEVLRNEIVIGILGKGDIYGADVEGNSQIMMTSHADVKALTYCEVECISVQGIFDVYYLYPEFADSFIRDIKSDYSCNLWESESHATKTFKSRNHSTNASEECFSFRSEEIAKMSPVHHGSSPIRRKGARVNMEKENSRSEFAPLIEEQRSSNSVACESPQPNYVSIVVDEGEQNGEIAPEKQGDLEDPVTLSPPPEPRVTTRLDPTEFYFHHEQEKQAKKRRGFKSFLRSLSASLGETGCVSTKEESSYIVEGGFPATAPSSALPSCIRKKSLTTASSMEEPNKLSRSASDNLNIKRVKFVDDDDFSAQRGRANGRKSVSCTEEDLKYAVLQLSKIHKNVFDAYEPELSRLDVHEPHQNTPQGASPDPQKAHADPNASLVPQAAAEQPQGSQSCASPLRQENKSQSSPQRQLSTLKRTPSMPGKPLARRRRRQRRKSLSPSASSQIRRVSSAHDAEREFLSDTVTQQRARGSPGAARKRLDSSGSDDRLSDNVFRPSPSRSWPGGVCRRGNSWRAESTGDLFVESVQDLISKVATLNAEVQRLSSHLYNESVRNSSSVNSLNFPDASPRNRSTTSSAPHSGDVTSGSGDVQFTSSFRAYRLPGESNSCQNRFSPARRSGTSPEPGGKPTASAMTSRELMTNDAPVCVLTSPSGVDNFVDIDMDAEIAGNHEGLTRPSNFHQKPPRSPMATRPHRTQPPGHLRANSHSCPPRGGGLSPNRFLPSADLSPLDGGLYHAHNSNGVGGLGFLGTQGGHDGFVSVLRRDADHWGSCHDLDDDWRKRRLGVPLNAGRGNESGYISNSPTIQL